jgi:type IV pilus assembly protein PilQ
LVAAVQAAENQLEAVDFAAMPGGAVQIILRTTAAVSEPASFTTDSPARIAMDFNGLDIGLAERTHAVGIGSVQSVSAVKAGDRTRVVINLVQPVAHQMQLIDNGVLITVGGTATQAAAAGGPAAAPAARPSAMAAGADGGIQDIDFRRGPKGEGRVLITLSDPATVVDVKQEGTRVVLDVLDIVLPAALIQELDVMDFATPVTTIRTRPRGANVRMEIATTGEYEYLAYQTEDLYVVEFRPLTKQEKALLDKKRQVFTGERLSLNFQDIEVRAVLQLLADFTGLNLVTSDTVSGRVTLRLKNVPWDQALDIILKTKGLAKRQDGNVMLVAPIEEIAAREKLELESQQQIEELAPLRAEYIQVNYAKAEDLAALLKSEDNPLLTPARGNVSFDQRTNTLLVQDTAAKLDEIRGLIEILDIPIRQVMIESRIVIAQDNYAKDLGVRFGFNRGNSWNDNNNFAVVAGGLEGHTAGTFGLAPGIENPADSTAESLLVNLPVVDPSGAVNFIVGKLGSYLLQLELSAMQTEGKGEVISSPRVITSDQNTATIKQGQEIPYQSTSGNLGTNVQFKEAVLKLDVTPHITPDDRILMDLVVNKDNANFAEAVLGQPPIDTRSVQTTVLVDNGETVVLGGIFERETSEAREKVPFFGDVPYLGNLFKRREFSDENRELLVFVTPRILKETLTTR